MKGGNVFLILIYEMLNISRPQWNKLNGRISFQFLSYLQFTAEFFHCVFNKKAWLLRGLIVYWELSNIYLYLMHYPGMVLVLTI